MLCSTAVSAQSRAGVVARPRANAVAVPATGAVTARFARALPYAAAGGLQVFSAQRGGRRTQGPTAAVVQGTTLRWAPAAYPFQPGETVQYTVAPVAGPGAPWVGQFTVAVGRPSSGAFRPGASVQLDAYGPTVDAAVGDLNGDGWLDLVTVNPGLNTRFPGAVEVRLNTGRGAFRNAPDVEPGLDVRAVVLADVDGDGDLDLLLANADDNAVQTCLNDGKGRFRTRATTRVGASPASVAVGDVDGDGDLDVVTANYYDSTLSVRRNDGRGVFSRRPGAEVRVGKWPYCVVLADVDNDGDLDLLAAHGDSANAVSVRRNDGAGHFGGRQEARVGRASGVNGSAPHGLVAGDVDGDGDADLLLALAGRAAVGVCRNDGKGGYGPAQEVGVGPGWRERDDQFDVALGDLDGDGDLDLLALNQDTAGTVSVHRNDGRGGFASPQVVCQGASGPVTLGDLDGDGDLDLVLLKGRGVTVASVQLNDGTQPRRPPLVPPLRSPAIIPAKSRK